jgi:hypothetical protein
MLWSSSAAWFEANKPNSPGDKRLALPDETDDEDAGEGQHLGGI